MTLSEKFVAALCGRAFLRLWTHPNPVGKKGKELCDCLIVCGPHVVIVSVKEIQYRDTGDKTGWERWHKAAIDESASQIWGAERWLASVDQFKTRDGRIVTLPPKVERKVHRIAISLGARGQQSRFNASSVTSRMWIGRRRPISYAMDAGLKICTVNCLCAGLGAGAQAAMPWAAR